MIVSQTAQVKLLKWRSFLLFGLLVFGLLGLAWRALYLQVIQKDFFQQKGASRYSRVVEIGVSRGMITDRHGEVLAISSPVASVVADPQRVEITDEQLKKLSSLLGMDAQKVGGRLGRENS